MTHIVHVSGCDDATTVVMDLPSIALVHIERLQALTGKWGGGCKAQVTVWTVDEWSEYCTEYDTPPDNLADQTPQVQQLLADALAKARRLAAGRDNQSVGLFQQGGGWSR